MFQNIQYEHFISGTSAGVISTLILHPLDLVKVRFQVNEGTGVVKRPSYFGLTDAFRRIWRTKGFFGLYQGVTPGMIGSGASWGLYFVIYNHLKRIRQQFDEKRELPSLEYMFLSSFSGAIVLCITNPIWIAKTRLVLQYNTNPPQYRGIVDCLSKIYRIDGFRGLYKGFVPGLFGTCHGSIQFLVYETCKNAWHKSFDRSINAEQSHWVSFFLGCFSKIIASTSTYPLQTVRSRMQDQHRSYTGLISLITELLRYEGVRGFYKGLVPCLVRVVPSSGIIFTMYEALMTVLKPDRHSQ